MLKNSFTDFISLWKAIYALFAIIEFVEVHAMQGLSVNVSVDQHIAAVEAVANQSTGTHKFCDMLLDGDEGSLLAMLSECLTTNNNDFQRS